MNTIGNNVIIVSERPHFQNAENVENFDGKDYYLSKIFLKNKIKHLKNYNSFLEFIAICFA